MIKLCGFPVSNYHNKVKLVLLEKGIAFEELLVYPSQDDAVVAESPMGKVPFLRLAQGTLAESQAISEYIEERYPDPSLFPKGVFERAKVRELIEVIELHLELPARRLYGEAFFGGKASEDTKREVEALLRRGLRALERLAQFSPFIAGETFSHADCAAIVHLPMVIGVTKAVFGNDMLAEAIPTAPIYLKTMADRPASKIVNEARKAGLEAFIAKRRSASAR